MSASAPGAVVDAVARAVVALPSGGPGPGQEPVAGPVMSDYAVKCDSDAGVGWWRFPVDCVVRDYREPLVLPEERASAIRRGGAGAGAGAGWQQADFPLKSVVVLCVRGRRDGGREITDGFFPFWFCSLERDPLLLYKIPYAIVIKLLAGIKRHPQYRTSTLGSVQRCAEYIGPGLHDDEVLDPALPARPQGPRAHCDPAFLHHSEGWKRLAFRPTTRSPLVRQMVSEPAAPAAAPVAAPAAAPAAAPEPAAPRIFSPPQGHYATDHSYRSSAYDTVRPQLKKDLLPAGADFATAQGFRVLTPMDSANLEGITFDTAPVFYPNQSRFGLSSRTFNQPLLIGVRTHEGASRVTIVTECLGYHMKEPHIKELDATSACVALADLQRAVPVQPSLLHPTLGWLCIQAEHLFAYVYFSPDACTEMTLTPNAAVDIVLVPRGTPSSYIRSRDLLIRLQTNAGEDAADRTRRETEWATQAFHAASTPPRTGPYFFNIAAKERASDLNALCTNRGWRQTTFATRESISWSADALFTTLSCFCGPPASFTLGDAFLDVVAARASRGAAGPSGPSGHINGSLKRPRDDAGEGTDCGVCMASPRASAFTPCGHVVCCVECATRMERCPICRVVIQSRMRVFL
jgi:hypothetical protein